MNSIIILFGLAVVSAICIFLLYQSYKTEKYFTGEINQINSRLKNLSNTINMNNPMIHIPPRPPINANSNSNLNGIPSEPELKEDYNDLKREYNDYVSSGVIPEDIKDEIDELTQTENIKIDIDNEQFGEQFGEQSGEQQEEQSEELELPPYNQNLYNNVIGQNILDTVDYDDIDTELQNNQVEDNSLTENLVEDVEENPAEDNSVDDVEENLVEDNSVEDVEDNSVEDNSVEDVEENPVEEILVKDVEESLVTETPVEDNSVEDVEDNSVEDVEENINSAGIENDILNFGKINNIYELEKLTVKELQSYARQHNLKIKGKKTELIERIKNELQN